MHQNLELFFQRWTEMSQNAQGQFARIDALNWFNYLAFDIIGDLAFGTPFGMLENGRDIAEIRATPNSPPEYAPAIEILNRRGEVSGTLGIMPFLKPYAKNFPDRFFTQGLTAVENLAGMAVARVKERLDNADKVDRVDLLARLMEGRDAKGEPMGREELTAEAQTQLIAGSDTTSNTSCAIVFHVLNNPHVLPKLQKELDEALPEAGVPNFQQVKDLS
jgi:benzoate 4-monooxygenase